MGNFCIDCGKRNNGYNQDYYCLNCRRLNTDLSYYVIRREISVAGRDRWAKSLTERKRIREGYCRVLRPYKIIPWRATIQEVSIIDPSRLDDDIWQQEANISILSQEEAQDINTLLPETDFLTRWYHASRGLDYCRFATES